MTNGDSCGKPNAISKAAAVLTTLGNYAHFESQGFSAAFCNVFERS